MDQFSKVEQTAMKLLINSGSTPMYGLELVQKSDGALKRGTVYLTLNRLEDRGFLKSEREKDSTATIPRLFYTVTGAGRRAFHAWTVGQEAQRKAFTQWPGLAGVKNG
jgi:PadR family transcriptional regulator, regulatory protein PadR